MAAGSARALHVAAAIFCLGGAAGGVSLEVEPALRERPSASGHPGHAGGGHPLHGHHVKHHCAQGSPGCPEVYHGQVRTAAAEPPVPRDPYTEDLLHDPLAPIRDREDIGDDVDIGSLYNALPVASSSLDPGQLRIKVACVGASITEGVLPEGKVKSKSYPALLQKFLGPRFDVKNFGLWGRTVSRCACTECDDCEGSPPGDYRTTAMFAQIREWRPNIAILQFSHNDAKHCNWKRCGKKDFVKDYVEFIHELKTITRGKAKVYIMHPPPLYKDGLFHMNASVVNNDMPTLLPMIASMSGIAKPIDVFGQFKRRCPDLSGKSSTCDVIWDGVHPTEEGYQMMAKTVQKAIAPDRVPDRFAYPAGYVPRQPVTTAKPAPTTTPTPKTKLIPVPVVMPLRRRLR